MATNPYARHGKQGMLALRSARHPAVRCLVALLAAYILSLSAPVRAESEEPASAWQFAVTPYVWLPHIDTSLAFETPGTGGSAAEMNDVLKYLTGAFFINGEARKGRFQLALDFIYVDFTKADSKVSTIAGAGGVVEVPVNAGTTTSLGGKMVSLTGGYALLLGPDAQLDLLAGLRYTHIGATLDWNFSSEVNGLPGRSGSATQSADLWDGIVGLRGSASLGAGKWFVPYYLDAGAGTSRFTWQAVLGIGYSFHWGDLLLVYRYLSFEQGDDQAVQRFSLAGPALGATWHF
jgi:hypothetical protein